MQILKATNPMGYNMLEKNKYLQKTKEYLSGLMNQRAMLYLAIGGVSICLILIIQIDYLIDIKKIVGLFLLLIVFLRVNKR